MSGVIERIGLLYDACIQEGQLRSSLLHLAGLELLGSDEACDVKGTGTWCVSRNTNTTHL